jgi:hypothetical protein
VTDTNNTPTQTPGPHVGANDSGVFSDSERERRGPMGWIRGKLQERKERDAEKRNKTPERNQSSANGRQDFSTPVHMDSLPERPRDVTGSSAGIDTGAPPSNLPGAAVMSPGLAASGLSQSSPMAQQLQVQAMGGPVQVSSDASPFKPGHTRQPSAPSDPAMHDRVDAVMGGK